MPSGEDTCGQGETRSSAHSCAFRRAPHRARPNKAGSSRPERTHQLRSRGGSGEHKLGEHSLGEYNGRPAITASRTRMPACSQAPRECMPPARTARLTDGAL